LKLSFVTSHSEEESQGPGSYVAPLIARGPFARARVVKINFQFSLFALLSIIISRQRVFQRGCVARNRGPEAEAAVCGFTRPKKAALHGAKPHRPVRCDLEGPRGGAMLRGPWGGSVCGAHVDAAEVERMCNPQNQPNFESILRPSPRLSVPDFACPVPDFRCLEFVISILDNHFDKFLLRRRSDPCANIALM
jgi:hypothetical protein